MAGDDSTDWGFEWGDDDGPRTGSTAPWQGMFGNYRSNAPHTSSGLELEPGRGLFGTFRDPASGSLPEMPEREPGMGLFGNIRTEPDDEHEAGFFSERPPGMGLFGKSRPASDSSADIGWLGVPRKSRSRYTKSQLARLGRDSILEDCMADIRQIIRTLSHNIARMTAAGVAEAELAQLQITLETFNEMQNGPPPSVVKDMYQRIGEKARKATIKAYNQLVVEQEKPGSATHYRRGQGRFSGGEMLGALQGPGMFQATEEGIAFGNEAFLKGKAPQWYRLNFGSGERGGQGGGGQLFPFFDTMIGAIGSPGAASKMPYGFWVTGSSLSRSSVSPSLGRRGMDQFYPLMIPVKRRTVDSMPSDKKVLSLAKRAARIKGDAMQNRLTETRGNVGKFFFDAGVKSIADNLPKELQALVEQWFSHQFVRSDLYSRYSRRIELTMQSGSGRVNVKG